MIMLDRMVCLASVKVILVVPGGLRGGWVDMLDSRAYLASMQAIWVVLGGGRVVMLDHRARLASE